MNYSVMETVLSEAVLGFVSMTLGVPEAGTLGLLPMVASSGLKGPGFLAFSAQDVCFYKLC